MVHQPQKVAWQTVEVRLRETLSYTLRLREKRRKKKGIWRKGGRTAGEKSAINEFLGGSSASQQDKVCGNKTNTHRRQTAGPTQGLSLCQYVLCKDIRTYRLRCRQARQDKTWLRYAIRVRRKHPHTHTDADTQDTTRQGCVTRRQDHVISRQMYVATPHAHITRRTRQTQRHRRRQTRHDTSRHHETCAATRPDRQRYTEGGRGDTTRRGMCRNTPRHMSRDTKIDSWVSCLVVSCLVVSCLIVSCLVTPR